MTFRHVPFDFCFFPIFFYSTSTFSVFSIFTFSFSTFYLLMFNAKPDGKSGFGGKRRKGKGRIGKCRRKNRKMPKRKI
jgi:hypothetical protein